MKYCPKSTVNEMFELCQHLFYTEIPLPKYICLANVTIFIATPISDGSVGLQHKVLGAMDASKVNK